MPALYLRRVQGGGKTVELTEEFRTRAHRCLKLAHEAPTLEAQTHWLAIAQLWFNLAEHAAEQDARFVEGQSASPLHALEDNEDSNGHGGDEDPQ